MIKEERINYVEELMKEYQKESNEYLELAKLILDKEDGFRRYMNEKISPESYQKGLNEFIETETEISKRLVEKKSDFNDFLNEFSANNNSFSSSILTKVRKNEISKDEVEKAMNELNEDFESKYNSIIENYTTELNNTISKINAIVNKNRKFVIEYGDFQLTDAPTVNEYKPIYDQHDALFDKFIFEFQAEALRINFLAEQIKSTYNRVKKLIDENYDIFSELTSMLDN